MPCLIWGKATDIETIFDPVLTCHTKVKYEYYPVCKITSLYSYVIRVNYSSLVYCNILHLQLYEY